MTGIVMAKEKMQRNNKFLNLICDVVAAVAVAAAVPVQQIIEFCNSVSLNFCRKEDAYLV
jgi:hypothetical protein